MGLFRPVNSLVFRRNLWLILFSKIRFLFSLTYIKKSKIISIPNLCLFYLKLQWLLSVKQFCDFSINKIFKTCLGTKVAGGKGISETKSKQQSPCSNCMHRPVMSWGNVCSTWMHWPMTCMHQPVTSQANVCTYCMES